MARELHSDGLSIESVQQIDILTMIFVHIFFVFVSYCVLLHSI